MTQPIITGYDDSHERDPSRVKFEEPEAYQKRISELTAAEAIVYGIHVVEETPSEPATVNELEEFRAKKEQKVATRPEVATPIAGMSEQARMIVAARRAAELSHMEKPPVYPNLKDYEVAD